MRVKFKKLHPNAVTPSYAYSGDGALDLTAVSHEMKNDCNGILHIYDVGLAFEIPEGYVGLLFPRSSLATKTSLMLSNSVGVLDSNFRGSPKFIFRDMELPGGIYREGDRIGQLIIIPYPKIEMEEVRELSDTERNLNGYGSSGR